MVASADRSHAAVSGKARHDVLGQIVFQANTIDRLNMSAVRVRHDIHQPAKVILHRAHGRQTVQRSYDEICVPDPTEAIIPVPLRMGRLGNARGYCGDNRAGRLIRAEFERDGGANDGLLPFERNSQPVDPGPPVILCLLEFESRERAHRVGQGFIRPQNEVQRLVQVERGPVENVINGCIRRQPHRKSWADIADVVRSIGDRRLQRSIFEAGADRNDYARSPCKGPDPAYKGLRSVGASTRFVARSEINYFDHATAALEDGTHNGGILDVRLLGFLQVLHFDRKCTVYVTAARRPHQLVEDGVAVEAGKAVPNNASIAINQGCDIAVTDQRKIQSHSLNLLNAALNQAV